LDIENYNLSDRLSNGEYQFIVESISVLIV